MLKGESNIKEIIRITLYLKLNYYKRLETSYLEDSSLAPPILSNTFIYS